MTDGLGECRVGVNLIDFHYLQLAELWWVNRMWLCRSSGTQLICISHSYLYQSIECTNTLYHTGITLHFQFMGIHGFVEFNTGSRAQVACSVCRSLVQSAPSPFFPSSNSPPGQGHFKEGCLNLNISLQFA